jgi:hypothetical protein
MIAGKDARRASSLDAELDALVASEVDALAHRQARPNPKARAPRTDDTAARATTRDIESAMLEFPTHHAPGAANRPAKPNPAADNVIGMRHGGLSSASGVLAFTAEEEAFVEHAVAFLRQRPNADVIIEELWHHVVPDRDDDDASEHDIEARSTDEPEATDDGEAPAAPTPPAAVDPPVVDDDRVTPLQPTMAKSRTRNGTAAEPAPAKSAPPRSRQKRDSAERDSNSTDP